MSDQAITYSVKRYGRFCCQVGGDYHCSVEPSAELTFKYTAEVEADSLDGSGFVIDQNDLDDIFQNVRASSSSCEQLAAHFVSKIRNHVVAMNRGVRLTWVEVTLEPPPYESEVSADWSAEIDEAHLTGVADARRSEHASASLSALLSPKEKLRAVMIGVFVFVVLALAGLMGEVAKRAAIDSTETCADCGPDHPHAKPKGKR